MMGYVTTESHKMLYKDKELLPLMMMIKYLLKVSSLVDDFGNIVVCLLA